MYMCLYKLATFPHCDLFDREARAPTVTLRAGAEKEEKMKEKNPITNYIRGSVQKQSESRLNLKILQGRARLCACP